MSVRSWQPSRPTTILIGVLTVWPIVYFVLFLLFIGYAFMNLSATGHGGAIPPLFKYVFVVHVLTMLLMFALMATYIVHAFNTDRLSGDRKVLWVVVLFLGSIIAFPIYWYLYMWKSAEPPSTDVHRWT